MSQQKSSNLKVHWFFKIEGSRFSNSLEGLNSPLAQLASYELMTGLSQSHDSGYADLQG